MARRNVFAHLGSCFNPRKPVTSLTTSVVSRVAVLGGGISGLAAAHRLTELLPTAEVHLFEATDRLGGVLQTVKRSGFLIELAADNFLVKPSQGLQLCQRLGIADDLLTTDESRRRAFVVRSGRLIPVPDGFFLMSPRKLLPLLFSPALSFRGKLRMMLEPFVPCPKSNAEHSDYDESIASFTQRRLGQEVFEQLVQPLVAGIYTADPERLSMAATMPQFLEFERASGSLLRATLFQKSLHDASPRTANEADNSVETTAYPRTSNAASGARYGMFIAPKHGMASLITALAQCLPPERIHLSAPVTSITKSDNQWQLQYQPSATAGSLSGSFDAIVVALPAHHAASVVDTLDNTLAGELREIDYSSCAVVCLGFKRDQIGHPLNGFGFVVPHNERRRIIAGSFASLKFPGRAPEHHVLVRIFIGGALQPELLKLSDSELIRIACEELAGLLHLADAPVMTEVVRWPRSMPQYHVGHLDRVDRIEKHAEVHFGLALAGNAYHGVGIPQCIASGQAAARRIAEQLAAKPGCD